jgi:hypothetical protein
VPKSESGGGCKETGLPAEELCSVQAQTYAVKTADAGVLFIRRGRRGIDIAEKGARATNPTLTEIVPTVKYVYHTRRRRLSEGCCIKDAICHDILKRKDSLNLQAK